MPIDDNFIMPFGAYEGEKIGNIPAKYLLWIYGNLKHLRSDIKTYIDDNRDALEKELKK